MKRCGVKAIFATVGAWVMTSAVPVFAASCGGVNTTVIKCDDGDGINGILHLVINILSGVIGILAVAGVVFAGFQYQTSAGDAAKMAKAKNRIVQIVIGLLIYAVMWAVLDLLIPGGILSSGS